MKRHITTAEVEGHMPRIRWAQDEQSHPPVPTHEAPHHAASRGRRGLRRTFIAALFAALAVSVLGPAAADAAMAPDGGIAVMSVACNPWSSAQRTWGSTYKTTGYYMQYHYYVQSLSYPARSGWTPGWYVMGQGYQEIGAVATRGSGEVRVYVEYRMWNGSRYDYGGEWLVFQKTNTLTCFV